MNSVITSFSRGGLHEYGFHFIESFDKYWPAEVDLILYAEHQMARPPSICGRTIAVRRLDELVSFQKFMQRFGSDPLHAGRVPTAVWKEKDRRDGYSFKNDAIKFCRKVFAVQHAADQDHQQGVMAWIDADVRHLKRTPRNFIESTLAGNAIAYLGRDGTYTECGFLAFDLPQALPIIRDWATMYALGEVFSLQEWHDSFVFDHVRRLHPEIAGTNLTPGGRAHVWCDSPLAPFCDHLKGQRKKLGYSPEHVAKFGKMPR